MSDTLLSRTQREEPLRRRQLNVGTTLHFLGRSVSRKGNYIDISLNNNYVDIVLCLRATQHQRQEAHARKVQQKMKRRWTTNSTNNTGGLLARYTG